MPTTIGPVITFAGRADDVSTAAFALIESAVDRIDMSTHTGSHPRMGAVDVVPFVPVGSTAMDACVAMAQESVEGRNGTRYPNVLLRRSCILRFEAQSGGAPTRSV